MAALELGDMGEAREVVCVCVCARPNAEGDLQFGNGLCLGSSWQNICGSN